MVSSALPHEENRFLRSQPITPISERGGRMGSDADAAGMSGTVERSRCMGSPHLSTSAMRALNQFMNSEVSRLSPR